MVCAECCPIETSGRPRLRGGFVAENRAHTRPISDAELREYTLHVVASGESADAQLLGDFLIRQPTRHEPSDFDFPGAQVEAAFQLGIGQGIHELERRRHENSGFAARHPA